MNACSLCGVRATRFFKGARTTYWTQLDGHQGVRDEFLQVALCERCKQVQESAGAEGSADIELHLFEEVDEETFVVAHVLQT